MKHRAVIAFRIHDQSCVLLRGKKFLFANLSVATHQLRVLAPQFDELSDHFLFARLRSSRDRRESVVLRIPSKMIETSVTMARTAGCQRIYFVEIAKHSLDRCVHAVEVQAVNTGKTIPGASFCVPCPQPFDEFEHDRVAPHPTRKTPKTAQRGIRIPVLAAAGYKTMHPECVRPIRFERDGTE